MLWNWIWSFEFLILGTQYKTHLYLYIELLHLQNFMNHVKLPFQKFYNIYFWHIFYAYLYCSYITIISFHSSLVYNSVLSWFALTNFLLNIHKTKHFPTNYDSDTCLRQKMKQSHSVTTVNLDPMKPCGSRVFFTKKAPKCSTKQRRIIQAGFSGIIYCAHL